MDMSLTEKQQYWSEKLQLAEQSGQSLAELRIPVHHEHSFWFNVNTRSGLL